MHVRMGYFRSRTIVNNFDFIEAVQKLNNICMTMADFDERALPPLPSNFHSTFPSLNKIKVFALTQFFPITNS